MCGNEPLLNPISTLGTDTQTVPELIGAYQSFPLSCHLKTNELICMSEEHFGYVALRLSQAARHTQP